MIPEFQPFPKIARLNREIIITEKIDGTNAQIFVTETGDVIAGSRNRWLTRSSDNFGFAAWVEAHAEELRALGPGSHYGEWWGAGIQRGYGQAQKIFSLFNVSRWRTVVPAPPSCCRVVPVLYRGPFCAEAIGDCLSNLKYFGSYAASGFEDPEGIVIYHTAAGQLFKVTLKNDEQPKGRVQ